MVDKKKQGARDKRRIGKALKSSYQDSDKQAPEIIGWVRDDALSGNRTQVYASKNGKHALITHTGSKTATDWGVSDMALAFGGIGLTKRAKHADLVTRKAVKKYGDDAHITVAGHSLGGSLAERTGKIKGVDKVVTVNKGASLTPNFLKPRLSHKQTDYRHGLDPITVLSGGLIPARGGKTITNWTPTWNPHGSGPGLGFKPKFTLF